MEWNIKNSEMLSQLNAAKDWFVTNFLPILDIQYSKTV